MDYSVLYSWQPSTLTLLLLVAVAASAIILLSTLLPALSKIIKRSSLQPESDSVDSTAGISIIIASGFHSEQLRSCVENIYAQNFSQPIEIIIVNTTGEDYTEDCIRLIQRDYPEIKNTFVPLDSRNLSRRKLAITLGIKAASHPIVLLTSANATPAGENWLTSLMSHFNNGSDIIIGTTVLKNCETGESIGKLRSFDSLKGYLRKIPAAIKGAPVGADSANLAYRKSLFFDRRGFCDTLNLIYGDDDIFISEIAKDHVVEVDIAPDSILTLHEDDPARIYDLERKARSYTQSKLRRAPFLLSGFQDFMWWVWLIASVTAIIEGLPSLIPACVVVVLSAGLIIPLSIMWKRAALALSLPAHTALLPLLSLISPFMALRYKISFGKEIRNYTWQN